MEWWHEYILGPTNRVLSHARHWQASRSLHLYHLVFWALLSDRLVDWSIDTVLLPFFTWEILQKVSCLQLTSVIWSHGPWQLLWGHIQSLCWGDKRSITVLRVSIAKQPILAQNRVRLSEMRSDEVQGRHTERWVRWDLKSLYWGGKHTISAVAASGPEKHLLLIYSPQVIMSLSTPSLPTLSIVICHLHLFRDTTRSDSYCQGHQKKNYCRLIEGFPSKPRCPS